MNLENLDRLHYHISLFDAYSKGRFHRMIDHKTYASPSTHIPATWTDCRVFNPSLFLSFKVPPLLYRYIMRSRQSDYSTSDIRFFPSTHRGFPEPGLRYLGSHLYSANPKSKDSILPKTPLRSALQTTCGRLQMDLDRQRVPHISLPGHSIAHKSPLKKDTRTLNQPLA